MPRPPTQQKGQFLDTRLENLQLTEFRYGMNDCLYCMTWCQKWCMSERGVAWGIPKNVISFLVWLGANSSFCSVINFPLLYSQNHPKMAGQEIFTNQTYIAFEITHFQKLHYRLQPNFAIIQTTKYSSLVVPKWAHQLKNSMTGAIFKMSLYLQNCSR